MTDDPLDWLERLEAAATPGPWHWVNPVNDEPVARPGGESHVYNVSLRTTWQETTGVGPLPVFVLASVEYEQDTGTDAALIAEARNALPALLAVARAARRLTASCEMAAATGFRCAEMGAKREAWCRPCFTRPTVNEVAESVARLDALEGGDDG